MRYELNEARIYPGAPEAVHAAAVEVAARLGGKPARKPLEGAVDVTFNKVIGGRALLNRIQLVLRIAGSGPGQTIATAEIFPVDAVGNKLLFGVVGEPARLVANTFWRALEARLGPPPG